MSYHFVPKLDNYAREQYRWHIADLDLLYEDKDALIDIVHAILIHFVETTFIQADQITLQSAAQDRFKMPIGHDRIGHHPDNQTAHDRSDSVASESARAKRAMMRDPRQPCLIYCRVSDSKQMTRGDGLGSQETACREYADRMGYEVVKVFRDDFTGKSANRAGIKELLVYLKGCKRQTIVIVDDLNRLARSLRSHYAIRDAIAKAGGKLESPKRVFADDPDDDILEIIEAAFAGEHRRKNAEQTMTRMRARAMNGYWVFQAPWGYRYEKASGGGKHMVRDEPLALIIQEALEGYASDRFGSQAEVKRFFETNSLFPKDRHGRVTIERVNQILTQVLYSGYLEVPRWNLSLRKGQHEGLISLETFEVIQDRLTGKARAPSRKDINADFPMRGFIACGDCRHPMTATWSKGKGGRYPYYMCRQRGCASDGKSVARAKVEDALEALEHNPI